MSDLDISETCSCGATFKASGYVTGVREGMTAWRANHKHEPAKRLPSTEDISNVIFDDLHSDQSIHISTDADHWYVTVADRIARKITQEQP